MVGGEQVRHRLYSGEGLRPGAALVALPSVAFSVSYSKTSNKEFLRFLRHYGETNVMGRPPRSESPAAHKVQALLTDEELAALDDWRFARRIGSRSEAIRQLIAAGLQATTEPGAPAGTGPRRGSKKRAADD
jgi:hypothetical protein